MRSYSRRTQPGQPLRMLRQLTRLVRVGAAFPAFLLMLSTAAPAFGDGAPHGAAHNGATAGSAVAASAGTMEVVHAGYLALTGNIADLRSRVTAWQAGDEGSLGIAAEKLERIEVTLAHVAWPASLTAAITKTRAAVGPMAGALVAKEGPAAETAAKSFGDASHDVTHDFYGRYLPSLPAVPAASAAPFTSMAPHASYLDLTANIGDLKTRIGAWAQGDEGSLGVAQEKVERIAVLTRHMASGSVLAGPVTVIEGRLKPVAAALGAKNLGAAQAALTPLSDASHDLTHDFYPWLHASAGSSDPACVQAAYLDVTGNIADLRARVTAWAQGDEGSLGVAQEKVERLEALVRHVVWPRELASAIYAAGGTLRPMTKALQARDVAAAQAVAKTLGDASHDITHDYYGSWLTVAHASGGADVGHAGSSDAAATATPPPAEPNNLLLGGMGVAIGLSLVGGLILIDNSVRRPRPAAARSAPTPRRALP